MRFWIIVAALVIADAISPHWMGNRSTPTFIILSVITCLGLFIDASEFEINKGNKNG